MFEFLGSVKALGSGAINVASGVYSAVISGAHTAYTDYTETGSLRSAATSGLSAAATSSLSAAVNYSLTFTKEDLVQNALSFLKEKHEDHMLIELIESEIEDLLRGESKLFAVVNFVNAIAALHDLVTGATVSNYTYARYRVIYNTPPSFDDLKLLRELGLEDEVLDLVAKIELPPSGENIKIPKLGSINNAAWFFGYSIKNVEWLEELLTQGLRSAKSKAENILLNRGDDPKVNYVEFGIEQCAYAFIFGVIQGADQESQKKILSGLLKDIMQMIPAESLPVSLRALLNEAEHRENIIALAQKILKALDNKDELIKAVISGDQARIAAASGDIIDVAAALLRNGIVNDAQHVVETGVVDALIGMLQLDIDPKLLNQGKQVLSILSKNPAMMNVIAGRKELIKTLISGDQARIDAAIDEIVDMAAALLQNNIVGDAQHVVETGVVDTLLDTFVPHLVPRPHTEDMHNMIEQGKQVLSILSENPAMMNVIAGRKELIKTLISGDQARISAASNEIIDVAAAPLQNNIVGDAQHVVETDIVNDIVDMAAALLQNNIVADAQRVVETGVVDRLLDTFVPRLVPRPYTEDMHNMIEQGKQILSIVARNGRAVGNLNEIFSDNHFTQGEGLVELKKMVKAILTLTTNTAQPDTLLEIDPANLAGLEIHSDFFQNEITRIVAKHGIKVLLSPAFGNNYKPETIKPMLAEMLGSSLVNDGEREGFARFADLLLGAAGRINPKYMGELQENVTSVLDSLFNVMGLCSPKKKNELTNTDFRIDHLMGELFNTVSGSLSIIEQLNEDEDFIQKIALDEDGVLAIDRALKSKEVVGKLAVDHTQDAVGMVKFCNFLLQQQKAKGSLNFIKLFKDLGSLLLDENNSTVNAANLAEQIVEHINTVTADKISGDTKAAFNATMHYIAYFVSGSVADSGDKLTENFLEAEQGVFALIMQDPGRYLAKFLSLRTGGVMTLESQEAEALVKDPAVWQVALQSMRLCSLGSDQKMEKMKLTASIFKASMSSEVVRKMVFATSDQRVNALANPVIMMFALLIASIVLPHLAALLPFVNLTMALAAASPYAMATATVIMGASSSLYLVTKVQDIRQIYHYNNVGKDASTPIPAVVQPQAEKLVVASDANNKGGDIFKSVKDEEATQLEKNDADWILVGNDEACTMDEHRRRFDNSIKSAKLRSAATINRPIFSASVTTVSTAATIGVFASGVVIAPMLLVLLSSVAVGALIATVRDVACKNTCGEEVYMGKMKVEEFEAFARHKV
jgi:hypothetical protein